jgi:hypothetical protein
MKLRVRIAVFQNWQAFEPHLSSSLVFLSRVGLLRESAVHIRKLGLNVEKLVYQKDSTRPNSSARVSGRTAETGPGEQRHHKQIPN